MIENKKEEINEIINALQNCLFDEIAEYNFYDNIVHCFKESYKKSFTYEMGATKGVLIFENLGFVIKIPFCGDEDYNFCGAEANNCWDYCEAEMLKYSDAKADNINQCFAETQLLTHIDDYPIYIQEYAQIFDTDDLESSTSSKEEQEKVSSLCEEQNYNCFNSIWLGDVFNYFGEEIFYHLLNFIIDANISDLHNANIGYIGTKPVLVDYSSFND